MARSRFLTATSRALRLRVSAEKGIKQFQAKGTICHDGVTLLEV